MILGIDTSFANGELNIAKSARDERVKFVYSRCCYGSEAFDDDGSSFTEAHDQTKALGIPFGAYMFWLAWEAGDAQARHFLSVADGRYGQLSPVVDVEEGSFLHEAAGVSVQQRIELLAATLEAIKTGVGEPIIYTDPNTWSTYFAGTDAFAGHRFWIANYTGTPGSYTVPNGVKTVVLHQFSDGKGLEPLAGISKPDNNCDRDALVTDLTAISR